MRITVLGATGNTGSRVVDRALAAGHSVHALIRKPGSLAERPGLTVFVGDATNAQDVARVSRGTDAIVSALGGTKSNLMVSSVAAVVEANRQTAVRRFILMSSFAVRRERLTITARLATALPLKKMIKDKAASEELIRESDLDWTIVYATRLASKDIGKPVRVVGSQEKVGLRYMIAPSAVAGWMVAESVQNQFVKAEVIITQ